MKRFLIAVSAACLFAIHAQAQTTNQIVEYDGFGALETINGVIYPRLSVTPGEIVAGTPTGPAVSNGNFNFNTGSLPGIDDNVSHIQFIPAGFHAVDGRGQPQCIFQFNHELLRESGISLQTLAGGTQEIFATHYSQLVTGDWSVDVNFNYEADLNVTSTTNTTPWILFFQCTEK